MLNHLVRQAVQALGPQFETEVSKFTTAVKQMRPVAQPSSWLARPPRRPAPMAESRRVRDGNDALRGEAEIGTAAIRGGTVAGEHTVYLLGDSSV